MNQLADIFASHLREEATHFFPSLTHAAVSVVFCSEVERATATLYRYDVSDGSERYRVLVKARRGTATVSDTATHRPMRYTGDAGEKYWRESNALKLIESHFKDQDPSRFGFIRVLDTLPEHQAVMMVESEDPSLRPLFLRQKRFQSRWKPKDLTPIMRNVGAWLRHYHALPPDTSLGVRYQTKDAYRVSVQTFTDFLTEQTSDRRFFESLRAVLEDKVREHLPEQLPCGRLHGDFSTRNILIGAHHRVTVIDTLAKWHVPIYEDIGTFLSWFHTNHLQIFTQGWALDSAWLYRCEQAFLQGYFDTETIPYSAIALFEIQALLDKWTSLVAQFRRSRQVWKNLPNTLRNDLSERRFKAVIQKLLDQEPKKRN